MPSMEFNLVHSAVESQNSCGGAVESTDGVHEEHQLLISHILDVTVVLHH